MVFFKDAHVKEELPARCPPAPTPPRLQVRMTNIAYEGNDYDDTHASHAPNTHALS